MNDRETMMTKMVVLTSDSNMSFKLGCGTKEVSWQVIDFCSALAEASEVFRSIVVLSLVLVKLYIVPNDN